MFLVWMYHLSKALLEKLNMDSLIGIFEMHYAKNKI